VRHHLLRNRVGAQRGPHVGSVHPLVEVHVDVEILPEIEDGRAGRRLGVAELERPLLLRVARRHVGRVETLLRLSKVVLVRAFLDLPADAHPVRAERVVAEEGVLEAKAERRVSYLRLSQDLNAAFDVLPGYLRLYALDAHEVLVVERAQPFDPVLDLADELLDLRKFHAASPNARPWPPSAPRAGATDTLDRLS
jgi:hypothetical protein